MHVVLTNIKINGGKMMGLKGKGSEAIIYEGLIWLLREEE